MSSSLQAGVKDCHNRREGAGRGLQSTDLSTKRRDAGADVPSPRSRQLRLAVLLCHHRRALWRRRQLSLCATLEAESAAARHNACLEQSAEHLKSVGSNRQPHQRDAVGSRHDRCLPCISLLTPWGFQTLLLLNRISALVLPILCVPASTAPYPQSRHSVDPLSKPCPLP